MDSPSIAIRYLQRRVLLLTLIPLGLLFAITVTLARTYHAKVDELAREWFQRGNADLSAGKPAEALEDFRNALSYDSENNLIQLRLAEALLADGRLPEANSYFLNLWDRTPGSGEVNLNLARTSARMGDAEQAIRHYQTAIYGNWETATSQHRRNARLELCKFLLENGRLDEARAELAGLASDTPPEEAMLHEQTGHLFLKAADPAQAVVEFEAALRSNPKQSQWLEDAGKAAFVIGNYQKAETYLSQANRENPSPSIGEMLETVRAVLRNDPYLPGLSDEEQGRRSWLALHQGITRLRTCMQMNPARQTPQPSLELQVLAKNAKDLQEHVNLRALSRDSDMRNGVMRLVFQIEDETSRDCALPSGPDQALLLIRKEHQGSDQ
jgi:tetratricopeptide (TPR) repeat protein